VVQKKAERFVDRFHQRASDNMLSSSLDRARLGALLLLLISSIAGCGQPSSGAGRAPPAPQVSVAPSVQRQVQESDEFTARLEAVETVDVRPRVSGTIERVHFKEGQLVKRGDLLFSIDARPFRAELARAEAQLAASQTQSDLSKTEFARAQKLLDQRAISKQEFDQLQSGTRSSDANIRAAQAAVQAARLNVEYAAIRSPIAGRVSRANVTAGNLVGNAEPVLTTIVSQDKVYAYFDASEATYLKYVKSAREGTRPSSRENANPVFMGLANEQGFPHKGVIDFVDNRLNPQTGAIRARAMFDNAKQEFTPGLFARVRLIGSGQYNAVLVPDRAIGTDQSKKFVLVVGADNVAQFREVKLGALLDGMRVVSDGVKAGESVIVDGLQRVRPGMPVAAQKLEVDGKGMPIEKPQAPPGAPKQETKDAPKKDEKKA
jgi:membrane fusion protein, multidrug efflux system